MTHRLKKFNLLVLLFIFFNSYGAEFEFLGEVNKIVVREITTTRSGNKNGKTLEVKEALKSGPILDVKPEMVVMSVEAYKKKYGPITEANLQEINRVRYITQFLVVALYEL